MSTQSVSPKKSTQSASARPQSSQASTTPSLSENMTTRPNSSGDRSEATKLHDHADHPPSTPTEDHENDGRAASSSSNRRSGATLEPSSSSNDNPTTQPTPEAVVSVIDMLHRLSLRPEAPAIGTSEAWEAEKGLLRQLQEMTDVLEVNEHGRSWDERIWKLARLSPYRPEHLDAWARDAKDRYEDARRERSLASSRQQDEQYSYDWIPPLTVPQDPDIRQDIAMINEIMSWYVLHEYDPFRRPSIRTFRPLMDRFSRDLNSIASINLLYGAFDGRPFADFAGYLIEDLMLRLMGEAGEPSIARFTECIASTTERSERARSPPR